MAHFVVPGTAVRRDGLTNSVCLTPDLASACRHFGWDGQAVVCKAEERVAPQSGGVYLTAASLVTCDGEVPGCDTSGLAFPVCRGTGQPCSAACPGPRAVSPWTELTQFPCPVEDCRLPVGTMSCPGG
jgi:hypothetical protein